MRQELLEEAPHGRRLGLHAARLPGAFGAGPDGVGGGPEEQKGGEEGHAPCLSSESLKFVDLRWFKLYSEESSNRVKCGKNGVVQCKRREAIYNLQRGDCFLAMMEYQRACLNVYEPTELHMRRKVESCLGQSWVHTWPLDFLQTLLLYCCCTLMLAIDLLMDLD